MATTDTIWPIEEWTKVKHAILRAYLDRWFPILLHGGYPGIVYYDGFSGPGVYSGGEDGSPVIALRAATEHISDLPGKLLFHFVDNDAERCKRLAQVLKTVSKPKRARVLVENLDGPARLQEILAKFKTSGAKPPPVFALLDPFGFNIPFEVVKLLLGFRSCEALITVMGGHLERFSGAGIEKSIDALLGKEGAAEEINAAAKGKRIDAVRAIYCESLSRCAKFVRYFEMRNSKNRVVYDLFFVSNSPVGHYKMKEALWKVDETGDFAFAGGVDPNQAVLFSSEPEQTVAGAIRLRFDGQKVLTEEIGMYAKDETIYLDKHWKGALRLLEEQGAVDVDQTKVDGKPRRKGSFPEGVWVTFSNPS